MSFLVSILESYEGLIAGKIGNPNITKEDYDQVDPEDMELMDIRWCLASVIRKAQRFMEITGRKYLEGPNMKIGFDKAKVTCFMCKQKGQFKRESTNRQADDSVNPFHEDYYKKAIYHRTNEQPIKMNQKQIDEGSSKDRKQAMAVIHDDEGFNRNKYIPKEKNALVAEVKQSREERHARMYLSEAYKAFVEAKRVNRLDKERECFVDPQGNLTINPEKVDFEVLVVAIPIVGVWIKGLEENPNYRKEVDEGIKKVIYASVEKKKKTVEEIVDKSQKMVDEVKKTDVKAEEAVAEKQQEIEEDQNQKAKEATMPKTEVLIQTVFSVSTNKIDNKTNDQCKKCVETCSACTEKDKNLRSRDTEFTKIEIIFKEKCNEMIENVRFFKQKAKEATEMRCSRKRKQNFKTKVFS
ncbi:hypothetical protein HanPI659440_Chr04g0150211 [Helianthus annuus]|nr:hypothetical protein HanPI659440_Chr04g0150211 [Helianthus annuus]